MRAVFILSIIMTLFEFSRADCVYERGFTFRAPYVCLIEIGRFQFQADGNLVVYDGNLKALWDTRTAGRGETVVFQSDGNLVIYDIAGKPVWDSGTAGRGRVLAFQNDRNLVIYDNAQRAVWNSNTQPK